MLGAIDYPFDEFCDHMAAIHARQAKDRGDPDDTSFFRSLGLTVDYMNEIIPDPDVARYKASRFMLIAHYVASHVDSFDTGDYLVHGSKKVGALVGTHLLRAIHHVFTDDLRQGEKEPTPEEFMRLADEMKELSDGLPS